MQDIKPLELSAEQIVDLPALYEKYCLDPNNPAAEADLKLIMALEQETGVGPTTIETQIIPIS